MPVDLSSANAACATVCSAPLNLGTQRSHIYESNPRNVAALPVSNCASSAECWAASASRSNPQKASYKRASARKQGALLWLDAAWRITWGGTHRFAYLASLGRSPCARTIMDRSEKFWFSAWSQCARDGSRPEDPPERRAGNFYIDTFALLYAGLLG